MKRLLTGFAGLIVGVCVVAICSLAYLASTAIRPAHPVGVEQALASDPGHTPIAVTIFYPTDEKPKLVWMGMGFFQLRPNAALATGAHPLVIISHGTGASPTSHIDTALALAQAGYVVVAPMHPGDNYRESASVGTPDWIVDRARHIARVSDFMLKSWGGHSQIDAERVGLFGFSAGGTTALVAIGGKPDFARVEPHCASHPEFVCQLLKEGTHLRVPTAREWVATPAIKAAVVVAPGLGFTFEPAGLSGVTAPVQLWDGVQDVSVPLATNAEVVRRTLPGAPEFRLVPNAAHFSFLTPCGPTALLLPPMLCTDPPGFDRAKFHQQFNKQIVTFFDRTMPLK